MGLYGISDLAIMLFLALALTIPLTLIVAAFGLHPRIRKHKAWLRSVVVLCCLVLVEVFALFNNRSIVDDYDHAVRDSYTHHLRQPEDFDGMTFPAGSTVALNEYSPHTIQSGTVPADTPLLGMYVSGDFWMARLDNTSYVAAGTLARPASLAGIECAPGPFKHEKNQASFDSAKFWDSVDCTLAAELHYHELDLPAGTRIKVRDIDSNSADLISGESPAPWKIFGIQCEAGAFAFEPLTQVFCVSAVDQRVGKYDLLQGDGIKALREQDGSLTISAVH